jgi:hypothetical protein
LGFGDCDCGDCSGRGHELEEGLCYEGPHSADLSSQPATWYKTFDERGIGWGNCEEPEDDRVLEEMGCEECKLLKKAAPKAPELPPEQALQAQIRNINYLLLKGSMPRS